MRARDPFAVETADGFPVLHSEPASRPHAGRAAGRPSDSQKHVKSREKPPNKENEGANLI
ncbi:MAG: hypothetical protein LBH86_08375 [Oscillospiraceae bacterium]|nr:hypothetical protein [Oscillospiraceae bacterium]